MTSLDEVLQYRKRVEQKRKQAAKAEGRLESAMERLSHDHHCKDVKAGRKALEELRQTREKTERIANKKLTSFAEKWKDQLEA